MSNNNLDDLLNEALENIRSDRDLAREFLNEISNVIATDAEQNKYFYDILDSWDFGEPFKENWLEKNKVGELNNRDIIRNIGVNYLDAVGNNVNQYASYEVPKFVMDYIFESYEDVNIIAE